MKKWNIEPFVELASMFSDRRFGEIAGMAAEKNLWFTLRNIEKATGAIREGMLDRNKLENWLSGYEKPAGFRKKRVGVIMAGNIPMVGFADLLAVVAAGHSATVKLSSKDAVLMGFVVDCLAGMGCDVEAVLSIDRYDVDAVIATGSDVSRGRFEREFAGLPSLIRGSRYSVAVLTGDESETQLEGLAEDMFLYWGLGCRNVSRIYLPEGYGAGVFAGRISKYGRDYVLKEFGDCYRYSRAMESMRGREFYDGGFFVFRPFYEVSPPPLATVDYVYYNSMDDLNLTINSAGGQIQCVVADKPGGMDFERTVSFGDSQCPGLADYADGVDTMDFLLGL